MLIIHNISKSFGTTNALKNITFEVNEGEIFGLIGPDGAGKTTLFNILVTLLNADSGSAKVCGFDINHHYHQIRNIIGYLPGQFCLYQDLSCYENLNFFATLYGNSIEENYELIKPIWQQLEPFKNRRAGKLSGGMKQKLALCCALIHRPKALFLDEPTTGVDPVSRREFWDILHSIRKEKITILVSTPYMDEASLCNRVGLIQNGEILQIGTPKEITSQFLGTLYSLKTKEIYNVLQHLTDSGIKMNFYPFGQQIHITIFDGKVLEELSRFIQKIGHKESDLQGISPTIEDCFIQLMTQKQA